MTLKNLIKLDFYAMKPLAKLMICFLIIPIILGIIADLGASIMVTLTFVVFMLNMIFSIGEKSHFQKLYGVLPIKKSTNILSRYLFSLIIVVITAIVSFVLYIMMSLILNGEIHWVHGISFLTISIVIALFFISIQYPFYFKFEYSKATIISILPYVICFAIGAPLLQYLMQNYHFALQVMKLIAYFQSHVSVLVMLGMIISIVMVSCSYLLSLKIQKKEF